METLEINVKAKGPEHEFISCKMGHWYYISCGENNYGLAHFCQVSAGIYDFIGPDGNRWFDGAIKVIHTNEWNTLRVSFTPSVYGALWKVSPAKVKIVEEA